MKTILAVFFTFATVGCAGFENDPESTPPVQSGNDAAAAVPPVMGDAGMPPPMEMPPMADAGAPLGVTPTAGSPCDSDRERATYDCALVGCSRAYLACLGAQWRCVPDLGAVCLPPATDAGMPMADAGSPAATPDSGVPASDSGVPASGSDAGPPAPRCVAGSFVGCFLTCGFPGHIDCDPATGYVGACNAFAGLECPVAPGTDAGVPASDAGCDAGVPPATDAGVPSTDAGSDAGTDAGTDAGVDAGPPASTRRIEFLFRVDPTLLYSTSSMDFLEEMAASGATHADARSATCDAGTAGIVTEGGNTYFRCTMTRTVGTEFFFAGRFRTHASGVDGWAEGQTLATFSGWGRRSCGSDAATAHVTWVIRDSAGRSLLNTDGLPDVVQPRGITEDTYPVCRGRIVF